MRFFTSGSVHEIPIVVFITGVALLGLWISNIVYDRGLPQYVSRKIGHVAGGICFLTSLLFSASGWPILIAAGFGIMLLTLRLLKPKMIRGVGGTGRNTRVFAEVWFPWVAVPVFLVLWSWLNRPKLAVAGLLFMAWGDGVTGLVRSLIYKRPVKGLWGSLAMLGVCLGISWFLIVPFWIGIVVSVIAVIVEWAFGDNGRFKWADDNWAIPAVSMVVLLGLVSLIRNI